MAASTKVSDMCRLCGTDTLNVVRHHIFEGEGQVKKSAQKISECLPLHIAAEDPLPKNICGECSYKLDLMSDFREKAVKTDVMLVSLVEGVKPEIPDDDDDGPDHEIDNDFRSDTPVEQPEQQTEPEVLIKEEEAQQPQQPEKRPGRKAANKRPIQESDMEEEEEEAPAKKRGRKPKEKETAPAASATTSASTNPPKENTGTGLVMHLRPVKTPDLRDHIIKKHGDRLVIRCRKCTELFASFAAFSAHMPMHEGNPGVSGKYPCDFESCTRRFFEKDHLIEHMKHDHEFLNKREIWECADCDHVFSQRRNFKQHVKDEHNANPPSTQNDAQFKTAENKQVKGGNLRVKSPYKCGLCLQTFLGLNAIKAHFPVHTGESVQTGKYACDFEACTKRFLMRDHLICHFEKDHQIHNRTLLLECSFCDQVFIHLASLKAHLKEKHCDDPPAPPPTESETPPLSLNTLTITPEMQKQGHSVLKLGDKSILRCGFCLNFFASTDDLLDHVQTLHVEKYLCDFEACTERFLRRRLLIQHIYQDHQTENRTLILECTFCDLVFTQKANFQSHLKEKHSGDPPAPPPTEPETPPPSFNTLTITPEMQKQGHSVVKLDDKSILRCGFCLNFFASTDDLQDHVQTTHVEKYLCDFEACTEHFLSRGLLIRHIQKDHKIVNRTLILECSFCDQVFIHLASLKTHLKEKHCDEPPAPPPTESETPPLSLNTLTITPEMQKQGHSVVKLDDKSILRCGFCLKFFASTGDLLDHVQTTHVEKYLCDFEACTEHFLRRGLLIQHIQKDHKIVNRTLILECSFCDQVFIHLASLKAHLKEKHCGDPPAPPPTESETPPLSLNTLTITPEMQKQGHSVLKFGDKSILRCGFCLNFFASVDDLLDHVQTLHVEK
ncbi:zinc finger protein 423-like isoform X2 [Cloeon dipterum]|uniref:zinc finger protein 423-like isoform X2 n=1 Tax=Cloeon dipterum TaxID=197152 RepID=UPI00322093EF